MAATLYLGNLLFKATKGNGLHDTKFEDHAAGSFQPNMYDGLDRNKAVRLIEQIAVLGVRGDYLEMEMHVKTAASDGNDLKTESVFAEAVEYSGVPPDIQYALFGVDSPFRTGSFAVREGMLEGIEKQEIQFVNNVEIADPDAQTTAIAQKIRGSSDNRVTVYGDAAAIEDCSKFTLKVKPNSDGIFLLRSGAVIWMQPGVASQT